MNAGGGECLFSLGLLAYHQGRFADGQQWFTEAYTLALHSEDVQHRPWALMGQGALRLGQSEQATDVLEAARAVYQNPELRLEALINGLLSVARLHRGELDLALQTADTAATVVSKIKSLSSYMLEAYAGIAEVYLSLWETGLNRGSAEAAELAQKAQRACKNLLKYKRLYPSSAPRAWLWQGLYLSLAGQTAQAHKAWQTGLSEAERLAMPFEQGLLHYETGRHLDRADSNRKPALTRAVDLFRQTGAAWELERAEEGIG